MYYVYALYSIEYEKIYIGFTSDLERRLFTHNDPDNRGYTGRYQPWVVIYSERHEEKRAAIIRERQLKTAQGRAFIKRFIPG